MPWLVNMLRYVFHLYVLKLFLFILIIWVKMTAHGLQHGWSGLQVWVTFPLLTCALVVCVGRGCWSRKFSVVHLSAPLLRPPWVWVGGGGCLHSPRGPVHYLCLGLGSHLLGAWTSRLECVTW